MAIADPGPFYCTGDIDLGFYSDMEEGLAAASAFGAIGVSVGVAVTSVTTSPTAARRSA